jgi:hypothetical protein
MFRRLAATLADSVRLLLPVFLLGMFCADAALAVVTYRAVDLNPSGFTDSNARGASGMQQVGSGGTGGHGHALLWSGTAQSAIDLNPSGFTDSIARGASGMQQVGSGHGAVGAGTDSHALLWSGTAQSAIDLNPSGFTYSYAYGCSGARQVGAGGYPAIGVHALL